MKHPSTGTDCSKAGWRENIEPNNPMKTFLPNRNLLGSLEIFSNKSFNPGIASGTRDPYIKYKKSASSNLEY